MNIINVELVLRAVTGYFSPPAQVVYANSDLKITLKDNGLMKGKAVLFFNDAAFAFDKNKTVVIPAEKLEEINNCILQDQGVNGNVHREWRHIEALTFELAKLDKEGEAQMLAERELIKQAKTAFENMQTAFNKMQEEHEKEREQWAKERKALAAEIKKQGEVIAEVQKNIEAIKDEPIV